MAVFSREPAVNCRLKEIHCLPLPNYRSGKRQAGTLLVDGAKAQPNCELLDPGQKPRAIKQIIKIIIMIVTELLK